MSEQDSTEFELLPKNAPIYLGLAFGLLVPLLLGLFGGVLYSGHGVGSDPASSVAVYPQPE
ncbi:hypothetical protein C8N32_11637 [Rhodovulum imhoffii]|uniref:Uncharacterized protein n=1 Tax=Rhodovulum imhoffii TaxID=365340 RepID=A0A2T5BQ16_9RHOB|nr:hypothetical protein [Rhodovulum imhoffii]MBK5934095.1 hypothetical protein [Rhodovulum imhoffii]PTN01164.1 hypothetical protein C8N32_11637 [Rhodovulum imhoffii]